VVRYVETQGTLDQLQAFEQQAEAAGLTPLRQTRRKKTVDMTKVQQEVAAGLQSHTQQQVQSAIDQHINSLRDNPEDPNTDGLLKTPEDVANQLDQQQQIIGSAVNRNTTYTAKYKLTGYNINIQFRSIAQHYWICDPTVTQVKDQPFCGFYEDMTIAEAVEVYPGVNLEQFLEFAEYNNNGAYQAGSTLNNMAIHARDSVPIQGIPVGSGQAADKYARRITVLTVWDRYDIDGDGELELVELVYSGSYIISAKEVEFIPVASMCPKPLPGNFYGMSIAESIIPMQEYSTAAARAEIQLGLLTATPRLGVKPDKVDFAMLQDGESAIFVLDTKFDPATDIYQIPPPSGNLAFLEQSLTRLQQDTMAMIGMVQPQDTFNPEVMAPGNSGIKLQMALTPNQIIQDNAVRCAADGLRDALYLVWRTLIQYGDDYGVKKLAAQFHPDGKPEFMDFQAWDDMNFADRKNVKIEYALGMKSEENQLARIQIIQKCQTDLYTAVSGLAAQGTLTMDMFQKVKKPFEDILYIMGVKDVDTYLVSDDEVQELIKMAEQAKGAKEPTPAEKKDLSVAALNSVKAEQVAAEIQGQDPDTQLNYMSIAMGKDQDYGH